MNEKDHKVEKMEGVNESCEDQHMPNSACVMHPRRDVLKGMASAFAVLALSACGGPKEFFTEKPEQKESRESGIEKNCHMHDANLLQTFDQVSKRHKEFLSESHKTGEKIQEALPKYALELFKQLESFKGDIQRVINGVLGTIITSQLYDAKDKQHAISMVQELHAEKNLEKLWDNVVSSLKKNLPTIIQELFHGSLAFYDEELLTKILVRLTGRNIADTINQLMFSKTSEQLEVNRMMSRILRTGKKDNLPVMFYNLIVYTIAADVLPDLNNSIGGKSRIAFASGYASLRSDSPFSPNNGFITEDGSYSNLWPDHVAVHAIIHRADLSAKAKIALIKGNADSEVIEFLNAILKELLNEIVVSYESSAEKESHPYHFILTGSDEYMVALKKIMDEPAKTIVSIWEKNADIFTQTNDKNQLNEEANSAIQTARVLNQLLSAALFQMVDRTNLTDLCKSNELYKKPKQNRLPLPPTIDCITETRIESRYRSLP